MNPDRENLWPASVQLHALEISNAPIRFWSYHNAMQNILLISNDMQTPLLLMLEIDSLI
jgi:hypothetical protein